jgi:UvrB/uvrC motif
MNSFDELFNDFFNKKGSFDMNEHINKMRGEARKMMDILSNFKNITPIDENLGEEIIENLGEPTKIERWTEGDLFIERRIWNTPHGYFVKMFVRDTPYTDSINMDFKVENNLEELKSKLEQAIVDEKYEEAARLRDIIKNLESPEIQEKPKKRGRPKKKS